MFTPSSGVNSPSRSSPVHKNGSGAAKRNSSEPSIKQEMLRIEPRLACINGVFAGKSIFNIFFFFFWGVGIRWFQNTVSQHSFKTHFQNTAILTFLPN
jgi:hypothetical protein